MEIAKLDIRETNFGAHSSCFLFYTFLKTSALNIALKTERMVKTKEKTGS